MHFLCRYPYWACELLVADIPVIDNAIVETAEHMKLLFDFLIQPAPLPQTLSLYFVRVLQTLYTKKPYEVWTPLHFLLFAQTTGGGGSSQLAGWCWLAGAGPGGSRGSRRVQGEGEGPTGAGLELAGSQKQAKTQIQPVWIFYHPNC